MAYSDDEDEYLYGSDISEDQVSSPRSDVDDDCCEIEEDELKIHNSEKNYYTVLSKAEILCRLEEELLHVMSVLQVTDAEACILLFHYKGDVQKLFEQWFANEAAVRGEVRLLNSNAKSSNLPKSNCNTACGICFEDDFPTDRIYSVGCEHYYCMTCWRSYISTSINDGLGCLWLRCPGPKCHAVVGHDLVITVTTEEEKRKYSDYAIKSYVECRSGSTKWCPAPDCDRAIVLDSNAAVYNVTCLCSHAFCWNCSEEVHRPVECKIVYDWIMKNNSEAENAKWILAFSKPCPKCKRPIEKNHGCSHMTCASPCGYEFCWICLGEWKNHWTCNSYVAKVKGTEAKMKSAEQSIMWYAHHYERWVNNHNSRLKAMKDLHRVQTKSLRKLSVKVKKPKTELEFIVDAWKQIVECRRVLKWTYVYGYFLLHQKDARRQVFEYLQGEAEVWLERLHDCAESGLSKDFHCDGEINKEFIEFQRKLARLTKVTGTYFDNLVTGLENGLWEVQPMRKKKWFHFPSCCL